MFRRLDNRPGHYLLLLIVWSALGLPNLGGPSLWDIDEGNNAEAARMMLESGDYVVPTFNGELRVDKPALLYWLQATTYQLFGVSEFSARLPSALAALVTVLLTYELARRMFGAGCGMLAGVVLVSSVAFCMSGHFANPDALLLTCTVATFLFFWRWFETGRTLDLILIGVAGGLGLLAKGPVAVILPSTVTTLFLLWSRQWRRLFDGRLLLAVLAFLLTAGPWYVKVAADTKMEFLYGFLLKHNLERFQTTLESHRGPFFYYLIVLFFGFMPWAVMMGLGCWSAWPFRPRQATTAPPPEREVHARRFLWCWLLVYLIFFSAAQTKLPNYILPGYVPLAVCMGHFLDRWRRGDVAVPVWWMVCGVVYFALVGVGFAVGVFVAGGRLSLPFLDEPPIPGIEAWAWLGLVPLAGAMIAAWRLRQQDRTGVVITFAAASALFVGVLSGGASFVLETEKSPRTLARAWQLHQSDREVRLGCYRYFQPSLVFYSRREVALLNEPWQVKSFLESPLEVFLCLPEAEWQAQFDGTIAAPLRVIARQRDLYHKCDVVIVTNR